MKNIISIILIVTSIALSVFFTNKKYEEIKVVQVQNEEYKGALEKATEVRKRRDELQKKYNEFNEGDLKKLEKIVPNSVDNIQLLVDIDNIASKKGMVVKNTKIEEEKVSKDQTLGPSKGTYSSLSFSFNTSATYSVFLDFLSELEKSQRIVDITALSFKSTENGVYDYSITIKTYWLKPIQK